MVAGLTTPVGPPVLVRVATQHGSGREIVIALVKEGMAANVQGADLRWKSVLIKLAVSDFYLLI